jgi:uncharacterized protein YraI
MRPITSLVLAASAAAFATLAPASAETAATLLQSSMMHDGPAARFPRLGVVERDQQVTVKGCNKSGRWCEIEADGKHGWVMGRHLSMGEPASAAPPKPSAPAAAQPSAPAITVETDKVGKGDRLAVPGKPVTIVIKSADGKVSSTMTVAAGSNVVVTASGRSRCELKAAVNP